MSDSRTRTLTKKMLRVGAMEFRLTAANKAFVVITIIGPFLIVALSILPSLLAMSGGGTDASRIALVGNESLRQAVAPAFAESAVELADFGSDEAMLRAALGSGDLDAYVVLPEETTQDGSIRFVSAGGANFQLVGTVEAIIGQVIVAQRLAEAGFDPARVRSLTEPPTMEVRRIDGEGEQEQDMMSVLFTALGFTFMLYMTVLLYGQSIGNSVLREKRSKTVEIMLSSLSSRELLVGKIAGKAAASLLQYTIWIGMAVLFLQVLSPLLDLQISLAGGAATYFYLVGFFLLAFLLYSTVYAALGAAAEDEQHLSQLAWPVIFFLVIPMIMIGATTSNPDGTIVRILALFPMTSPIVMFQRLLIGNPATWEVLLCVGLLAGSIVGAAFLAARIFRVGILMTGKRFTLGEILRWLRYR
ncbi:MAG: ABC transporter permease [Spirochaetota bacterium]